MAAESFQVQMLVQNSNEMFKEGEDASVVTMHLVMLSFGYFHNVDVVVAKAHQA